jgi:hypothetical protein
MLLYSFAFFKELHKTSDKKEKSDEQRREDDDKLLDLALEWDYIDGVLPILQTRQDAITGNPQKLNEVWLKLLEILKVSANLFQEENEYYKEMFYMALIKNRPTFVEYFLTAGVDPRTVLTAGLYPRIVTKIQDTKEPQKKPSNLYKSTYDQMNKVLSWS